MIVHFILLVLSLAPILSLSRECPEECQCAREKGLVICSGQALSSFPRDLPPWTTHLHMEQTSITSLRNQDLSQLANLVQFKFTRNEIQQIESGVFSYNNNIDRIDLSNNKLRGLPSYFLSGHFIQSLDLSSNLLESFNAEYLSQIGALHTLYLQSNILRSIEKNAFCNVKNLTQLYLNYNLLDSPPKTDHSKPHKFLQVLDMSENPLGILSADSLRSFPNVHYMYLEHVTNGSNLVINSRAFKSNKAVQKLDLSHNEIITLPRETLEPMSDLRILDLASNRFASVPNLRGLNKLQYVHLSDNRLSEIQPIAFSLNYNLREIHLDRNYISQISPSAFDNLTHLSLLDLSKNEITHIPEKAVRALSRTLRDFTFKMAGTSWSWLEGNPITCDCTAKPLHAMLVANKDAAQGVFCNSPYELKGRLLHSLLAGSLVCEKPAITHFYPPTSTYTYALGQSIELQCSAVSDNTKDGDLEMQWVTPANMNFQVPRHAGDPGDPLTQSTLGRTTTKSDGSLEIYNAQVGDTGTYTCLASNSVGKTQRSIFINVTSHESLDPLDGLLTCDVCDNDCSKYRISKITVTRVTHSSVDVSWMPTELRQAQYYVTYRVFADQHLSLEHDDRQPKSIKVVKWNNYTVQDLKPDTSYVLCVQMAEQPCGQLISFHHCVDITTNGSGTLGSSVLLVFIGFCGGTLIGLLGCLIMAFQRRQAANRLSRPALINYKLSTNERRARLESSEAFIQPPPQVMNGCQPPDVDMMYPDIYAGTGKGKVRYH